MAEVTTGQPVAYLPNKLGKQSLQFKSEPRILATYTVVGPMEGEGPLGGLFHTVLPDTLNGQTCWEKAEQKMLEDALQGAAGHLRIPVSDIDVCLCSDLLNQNTTSNFSMQKTGIPHLGIFSACAGFAEGLLLGSVLVDGGYAARVAVGVASHHDAAERQYRFPTELGTQRPPTAQWTVTAAAVAILGRSSEGGAEPAVTFATAGRVLDLGQKEPYDMGSAMAPAAADTIKRHFSDTGRNPADYDVILTGDLARVGSELLYQLLEQENLDIRRQHQDAGILMYDPQRQDVHSGGSGPACSAAVFSARFLPALRQGTIRRLLLVATGALHSVTTYQQGETIPAIAHAVAIESRTG